MKSILILICLVSLPLLSAFQCPGPNWKPRQGSSYCYLFSPAINKASASWADAQEDCRARGGRLVDIENSEEYTYLTSRLGETSLRSRLGETPVTSRLGETPLTSRLGETPLLYVEYWLGLTHAAGSWRWTDGDTPFVPNSIGTFNPNGSSEEFADLSIGDEKRLLYRGVLAREADGRIRLTAARSRDELRGIATSKNYICKANHKTIEFDKRSGVITKECGEGWILMSNHCYKFNSEAVNYELAAQTCQNQGPDSNLLYISSIAEEKGIRELDFWNLNTTEFTTMDSYWLALQVIAADQWYWKYRNSSEKWTIPMAYTNWASDHPDLSFDYSASKPICGYMRGDQSLQWKSDLCNGSRSYICKKKALLPMIAHSTFSPPAINFTYGCPTGWTKSGENCFQRNDTFLSWKEAQTTCRLNGAKLANLVSPNQHQLMLHVFNGAWIGMNSLTQPKDPRQFLNDDATHPIHTPWLQQISRPGGTNGPDDANCVASLSIDGANLGRSVSISQYSCQEERPFVCMIPVQPLELQPADCVKPPEDEGCRRWGYGHRGSCFYMGNDPGQPLGSKRLVTFDEARRFCQEYFGGDLAVLDSADKQEFMTVLLGTWASEYWIGLRGSGNSWAAFQRWINNESIPLTNWAHGQPSLQHEGKGCVAMHGTRNDHNLPGDWYVAGCLEQKFAVCEAPRQGWTGLPVVPTPIPSGCPLNWTTPDETSKNCYKAFFAPESSPGSTPAIVKLTWQEAEDSCVDFGGHLASVSSEAEQNHILQKVLKNSQKASSYWIGLSEDAEYWKWSDGSPFLSTTFFDPVVDHSLSNVQDCVAITGNSGSWIKQNCQMGWSWICQIPKGVYHDGQDLPTVPTPTLTNATCGVSSAGDWFYDATSDNCFFVSKNRDSWVNSEQTCNLMDSHLATIEKTEHPFVTKILSRHNAIDTLFWIGLRLQNPVLMTHHWVDGNLASIFRAWDKDEPNPKGVQACVVMSNRNGMWKDDYCLRPSGYRFVCRKSKAPVAQVTTVSPVLTETWGCPLNCTNCLPFRDSCYYFSPTDELKSWDEAREICRQIYQHPTDSTKSSDLASIHDAMEQDFLFSHFALDQSSRWIGLHEDWDKVTMFWSDHTPFDFSFWEGREPLWNTQPECVHMYGEARYGNGHWNDLTCSSLNGYICKMKKDPTQPVPAVSVDRRCDSGFEYLNGACFGVFPMSLNQEPQTVCSTLHGGARPATITSPYENAFVRILFAKLKNQASTFNGSAWIGGKEKKKTLIWNSGCFPSFNNIHNFYTTDQQSENCLAIDYDGKWRTQACNDTNDFVVCEKRPVECAKLIPENNGTCPLGFDNECHDYCYDITHSSLTGQSSVGVKVTWDVAKSACIKLNASIVSIRNEKEQKCLEKYIETSTSNLWIGLYEDFNDLTKNGTWKWLDEDFGYEGNYMNWQIGEPNRLNIIGPYRESCTEMMPGGLWNNVPCGQGGTRGYICEKLKIPLSPEGTEPNRTETVPTVVSSTIPGNATKEETSEESTAAAITTQSLDHTDEGRPREALSSNISSEGLAGLALTVILLVPALTVVGFIFWKRKKNPSTSSVSYNYGIDADQTPVLVPGDDVFT